MSIEFTLWRKGVVKMGWQLGSLECEKGNEERVKVTLLKVVEIAEEKVKIGLTVEWKGQWRKVEKLVYKNMKGALKKGSLEVIKAM